MKIDISISGFLQNLVWCLPMNRAESALCAFNIDLKEWHSIAVSGHLPQQAQLLDILRSIERFAPG